MKNFLSIAIVMLATVLTLAPLGCSSPPNPPSANANMATPEATPDMAAIEKELLRIENDWPRIIKEHDGQAVRRVDADDQAPKVDTDERGDADKPPSRHG